MQQQLIIIDATGESVDTNAVIQGAAVIDVVTCSGDVTMTLDGTMHLTMRQGDVKHVDEFKRIRLAGSAQTVVLNIGKASEDSRHVGLVPGGPGTVTPATAFDYDGGTATAGSLYQTDVCPNGKTLVKAYVSLGPLAPGPVYIVNTALGGLQGLQLMPGETSPALTLAHGSGASKQWIGVLNLNAVDVAVTSYGEYIN